MATGWEVTLEPPAPRAGHSSVLLLGPPRLRQPRVADVTHLWPRPGQSSVPVKTRHLASDGRKGQGQTTAATEPGGCSCCHRLWAHTVQAELGSYASRPAFSCGQSVCVLLLCLLVSPCSILGATVGAACAMSAAHQELVQLSWWWALEPGGHWRILTLNVHCKPSGGPSHTSPTQSPAKCPMSTFFHLCPAGLESTLQARGGTSAPTLPAGLHQPLPRPLPRVPRTDTPGPT